MKNSELKRLVEQYKVLKSKKAHHKKIQEKLREIEQRYYHETGELLKLHLEDQK